MCHIARYASIWSASFRWPLFQPHLERREASLGLRMIRHSAKKVKQMIFFLGFIWDYICYVPRVYMRYGYATEGIYGITDATQLCRDSFHKAWLQGSLLNYQDSIVPQIAIAIGVLTSNRGEGDEPLWRIGRGTRMPLQGAVDVVPLQGAIAGCHCRVPLQGAIVVCYGRMDVVPLLGAIAGCHCSVLWLSGHGPIAGCHCRVPL